MDPVVSQFPFCAFCTTGVTENNKTQFSQFRELCDKKVDFCKQL